MPDLLPRLPRALAPRRLAPLLLLLALSAAPASAQRAISFAGGSGSGGVVTLPNAGPWNAVGDFEIAFRVRDVPTIRLHPNTTFASQPILNHNGFALYVLGDSDWMVFNMSDIPGGLLITISTRTYFKVRHERASGVTTLEGWDADGSNYFINAVKGTPNITRNFSGQLGVGRDAGSDGLRLKGDVDWIRWKNSAGPKGAMPRDCDFRYDLLRYEFENDAKNSANPAGTGPDIQFAGGPAFVATPGISTPLVVCAGEDRTAKPDQTVSFDASDTYSNAGPVAFSWTQESGPQVNLSGANTAAPSFVAPQLGAGVDNAEVVLKVTATNNNGFATDTVRVGLVRADALDRVQLADAAKSFIIGPQVMAGSTRVMEGAAAPPAPQRERFERKYNMELAHWIDRFPAKPPSRKKPGKVTFDITTNKVTAAAGQDGDGIDFSAQIEMDRKADGRMSRSIAIRDPGYETNAQVLSGGAGYTSAATCWLVPNQAAAPQTPATCSATVSGGRVTAVQIVSGGAGYENPPRVEIREPGHTVGAAVDVGVENGKVIGNRHFTLTVVSIDANNKGLTVAAPLPPASITAAQPWHTDTVDAASGKYAAQLFQESSRYDLVLIAYRQFYRTGLTKWRDGARKVADSRWASDFIGHGTVVAGTGGPMHLPPFVAELGGLIMRAADGRLDYWDYVHREANGYLDEGFNNLTGTLPGKVFGADSDGRNAGWSMEWAAMVAAALPDAYPLHPNGTLAPKTNDANDGAAKRAALLGRLHTNFELAHERLQFDDGSWRWDVPNWPHGALKGISQPFMVGIMLEGLVALHRLTPDCAKRARMEAVMKKALDHLDSVYLKDAAVIPKPNSGVPTGFKWRAAPYFSRGGPVSDLDKFHVGPPDRLVMNDGHNVSNETHTLTSGDGSVRGARWQQPFWLYPAGYYYSVTGDTTYKARADEYFDSVWGDTDAVYWYGTGDQLSDKPKDFGEAYSTAGLYLSYRLGVTGNAGGGAPTNLTATASKSGTVFSVSLAWTALPGNVTGYTVERRGPGGTITTFEIEGDASGFTNTPVDANAAYVYRVRAKFSGGAVSCASNGDLATTFVFTDDPLVSFADNPSGATRVKAVHIKELRDAVDAVRAATGTLSLATWTHTVASGAPIRREDVTDLRDRLREALVVLGISETAYTDLSIQANMTRVRKPHVQEIRDALK